MIVTGPAEWWRRRRMVINLRLWSHHFQARLWDVRLIRAESGASKLSLDEFMFWRRGSAPTNQPEAKMANRNETKTNHLRFVERDGKRILQQHVVVSEEDEQRGVHSIGHEWHDIPLVQAPVEEQPGPVARLPDESYPNVG